MADRLHEHLVLLYGEPQARALGQRLSALIERYRAKIDPATSSPGDRLSERDTVLITYGDMVQEDGRTPLDSLAGFLDQHLAGSISTVHLLPFYPFSSDDGFSVIDYKAVDPGVGNWEDVARLGRGFRLMMDAVVNHISARSAWFGAFLRDEPPYKEYFITVDGSADLSQVFRPRALPLLTEVQTVAGPKAVWTTFSADQIDLNYANPDVLLEVVDTLLFYVSKGAQFIRLDAIAYLWKEIGTSSIHLPQTHSLIQVMRAVLDLAAPHVSLITETNVPHEDNISYFGDGSNEAQMVYNFSLPPLTLHAIHTGDATLLSEWAAGLSLPSDQTTFFNFLASHDGIGVTPARNLLTDSEVQELADRVEKLGGAVSYKTNSDGSKSAYELNINYLDALRHPSEQEDNDLLARRFLLSQAIMLSIQGVPGIYFHSLVGSRNWSEGVEVTGRARTINREKLQRRQLERELSDPNSLRYRVFKGYLRLLKVRVSNSAFHPSGGQEVVGSNSRVFSLLRSSVDGQNNVLCLHNVSGEALEFSLDAGQLPFAGSAFVTDQLGGRIIPLDRGRHLNLAMEPYEVLWFAGGDDG
jgi:sucrose phosphorylase